MNKRDYFISNMSAVHIWDIEPIDIIFGDAEKSSEKHIIATSESARIRRIGVCSQVISHHLPSGAVVQHKGEWVSGPEMLFLEFANELDFHHLVLFGLMLCGHRATHPDEAITTATKIREFVAQAKRIPGYSDALCACQYIQDGAASVMEALLYMILTLPNLRGGYGLRGASLNSMIMTVGTDMGLRNQKMYVDLLWKKARLVVEYDSRAYHDNPTSWQTDSRRIAALKHLGYDAISINTSQLYDKNSMALIAKYIAKALGTRFRIQNPKFSSEHDKLYALLPHHQKQPQS
jgi:very-short-patch-repair endonuclease